MSQFVKPVDLWDPAITRQIEAGALKLQRGQWVLCGPDSRPSRLDRIDIQGGRIRYIRAFHYPKAQKAFMACRSTGPCINHVPRR